MTKCMYMKDARRFVLASMHGDSTRPTAAFKQEYIRESELALCVEGQGCNRRAVFRSLDFHGQLCAGFTEIP